GRSGDQFFAVPQRQVARAPAGFGAHAAGMLQRLQPGPAHERCGFVVEQRVPDGFGNAGDAIVNGQTQRTPSLPYDVRMRRHLWAVLAAVVVALIVWLARPRPAGEPPPAAPAADRSARSSANSVGNPAA